MVVVVDRSCKVVALMKEESGSSGRSKLQGGSSAYSYMTTRTEGYVNNCGRHMHSINSISSR